MTTANREAMRMPAEVKTAIEGLGSDPSIYENALDVALASGASESEAKMAGMKAMVDALPPEHAIGLLAMLTKEMGASIAVKVSGGGDLLSSILGARAPDQNEGGSFGFVPASPAQAMLLTHRDRTLRLGDVVRWRSGMKNESFPELKQEVIVTDTFEPFRTKTGRYDVAVAIHRPCDHDGCDGGHLEEVLLDSRRLEFVRHDDPPRKAPAARHTAVPA